MSVSYLTSNVRFISFRKLLQSFLIISFLSMSNSGFAFDKTTIPELQIGMGPSREAWPFANLLEWTTGWNKGDSWDATKFTPQEIDAFGYPIMSPGEMAFTDATEYLPSMEASAFLRGRWVLTWQGDAAVDLQGNVLLVSGSNAEKRKVYDFNQAATTYGANTLEIKITAGTNYATNPVRNIRAWMPDPSNPLNKSMEPAPGQPEPIWNPLFLQLHNHPGEKVLRFMDWVHTNHSNIKYWSDLRGSNFAYQLGSIVDRYVPGSCWDGNGDGDTDGSWTEGDIPCEEGSPTPVAYQRIIDLCNTLNKDLWINIPHAATNGFIDSLAMLIAGKDPDGDGSPGLNPNLRVWVEFSNEIWAGDVAFRQGSYAQQQAAAMGITYNQWNARRFCDTWSIFQKHLPTNRMVRVAAVWTADGGNYTLPFLTEIQNYGPTLNPATQADVMAVTTYFGNGIDTYVFDNVNWQRGAPEDYDLTFRMWEQLILAGASNTTGRDVTGGVSSKMIGYSKQFNLPLVAYEGGVGLSLIARKTVYNGKMVPDATTSVGGEDFNFGINANTTDGRVAGAVSVTVDGGGIYNAADVQIVGTKKVNDNQWHQVAVVVPEGCTNLNCVQIFIDGVLDPLSYAGSIALNTTAYSNLKIGNRAEHGANFSGQIDDVRMYSRALSAPEIASLYSGSNVTGNLEGRWLFNDNGNDESGNNRSVTLRNGATYSTTKYEGTKALNATGDDYAEVYNYKGVNGSAARTISAFIKTSGTSAATIVGYGHPGPVLGELGGLGAVVTGEGDVNNNPYIGFILNLHRHPMMAQAYKTQQALVKASGLYMHSNFGDIGPSSKWGSWVYSEYLGQPASETPKRTFIQNWAIEEESIRELDNPLNNSPEFYTNPDLATAIVGEAYKAVIEYGGGDGTVTAELISSNNLPAGLTLRFEQNQIVIEGTPANKGFGAFYFMFRLLDGDKDPAYRKYTFRCVERSTDPEVFIDFENQVVANYDKLLEIGDYKFTATKGLNIVNSGWPSKVLNQITWNQTQTLERIDGKTFDLAKVDVAPNSGNYLVITGTATGGSTLVKEIEMPALKTPMTTVVLDWVGLLKVNFAWKLNYLKTDGRAGAIDNILINGDITKINQDYDGILKIDANQYHNSFIVGAHKWQSVSVTGAGGGVAMQILPNLDSVYLKERVQRSPVLEYKVNFTKTGWHYVWIKGHANGSANNDALHFGVDGMLGEVTTDMTLNAANSLVWKNRTENNSVAAFKISSIGEHTLNVWMKDDGLVLDSIYIKLTPDDFDDRTPPTVPTGLSVTGVTQTTVQLSWNASTDNTAILNYDVFKNGIYVGSSTSPNLTVGDLLPSSLYQFTALARDRAGNVSAQSTSVQATTTADSQKPTTPVGLSSSDITTNSFRVKWLSATDNVGVVAYKVYLDNVLTNTTNDTSIVLSGLNSYINYAVTVSSLDYQGNESDLSSPINVRTIDTIVPTVPANLAASEFTESSFKLSWNASTDNAGVGIYEVYRNGLLLGTTTDTYMNITGLAQQTLYNMTVRAKDIFGNSSLQSETLPVTIYTTNWTKTVGGSGADYATLKAAFDAINAGLLRGAINLVISGNTFETATASLNASGSGSADYSLVKIYPNGANRLIGSDMTAVTINLNGADNVVFDGSINGIGTDKNLIIENLSMSDGSTFYTYGTIILNNDATYNTIKNCIIRGSYTRGASTGVLNFGSSAFATGNSFNTISGNEFTSSATGRCQFAIMSRGNSTYPNMENVVSNNTFVNTVNTQYSGAVINIENYNRNWEISGNNIYETQALITVTNGQIVRFIRVGGTNSSGIKVTGNYIGGSAMYCGGTALTKTATAGIGNELRAIEISVNQGGEISDNTIQNIDWANASNISVACIYTDQATTPITISNNTIGGSADKKITYTTNVSDRDPILRGIYLNVNSTVDTLTISGNTISHLYGENLSTAKALMVYGVNNNNASNIKISNNRIQHLYGTGASSGSQIVQGIILANATAYALVSGNEISNLSNAKTGAGDAVIGINMSGDITNAKQVSGNFIHSLEANAGTNIYGIKINSGIGTYYNNIISLSPTSTSVIYGIYETGVVGNNHNLYHNTIYVGGSTTAGNSHALWINASTNTRDIRNNIFVNQRTNSGGTAKHYGVYFNATGGTFTLDYNDYYVSGTNYVGKYSADKAALADFRTATGQEANGTDANPGISTPGTTAATYKGTVALSGVAIAGVTSDYDGLFLRLNPPCIGAYELNGYIPTSTNKLIDAQIKVYALNGNIIADLTALQGESMLSVYDAKGMLIYKNAAKQQFFSIPVYQKGIYLVRVVNNANVENVKVLVR